MRRLEKHRSKKYSSQIFTYSVILIVVVLFLATIGFKFLISTSLFISRLSQRGANGTPNNNNETVILFEPELFNPPSATNTATLQISGNTTPNTELSIYINDSEQKKLTPTTYTFETEVELTKGENTLYILAVHKETKKQKQSRIYKILYKDGKPTLEMTTPADGDTVRTDEVQIVGKTDADVLVHINTFPVITLADGSFSHTVKLQEGENKIIISARDIAGNEEQKELTVSYQKSD
ncbi:MAG TPA: hypothetical protein VJH96_01760 [Patescibacteria group bacterium]|nr:hypothetical protein [Patescibacteria group bacterium]